MTLGHGAEGELGGQRIVYDVRRRIQAHRQSAEGTVVESTAITRCGEGDPGRVHHIGERLRWVAPEERLCSKTQRMEHERYLDTLRRVEAALHLWRAPNELGAIPTSQPAVAKTSDSPANSRRRASTATAFMAPPMEMTTVRLPH